MQVTATQAHNRKSLRTIGGCSLLARTPALRCRGVKVHFLNDFEVIITQMDVIVVEASRRTKLLGIALVLVLVLVRMFALGVE